MQWSRSLEQDSPKIIPSPWGLHCRLRVKCNCITFCSLCPKKGHLLSVLRSITQKYMGVVMVLQLCNSNRILKLPMSIKQRPGIIPNLAIHMKHPCKYNQWYLNIHYYKMWDSSVQLHQIKSHCHMWLPDTNFGVPFGLIRIKHHLKVTWDNVH